MKYILYLLVFAFFATGLTSCESDNPSSGSTTKELEVTPSKTSLGIYEVFTLKARMTNTPLSDVYIKVDFGEGQAEQFMPAGSERSHSYDKTGTYTITVTAYDDYTDAQLGTKTITMIVSNVIPMVAFDRDIIDTTVQISDYSAELDGVTFTFTTNAKISKVRYQFGDGVTLIDSTSPSYSKSYSYRSPGTYKVILDVYNDIGNYWASDTMTCIIRLQDATLDMLTGSYNVSVALAVDSTSSLYPAMKSYGHFDAGIGGPNDATPDLTWSGNSFNARYANDTRKDFHFTGIVSSDLKKLETMTVSIKDSIGFGEVNKYGYTLSNLEFYGMNNEVVIYRAAYKPLSSFTSNEFIQGEYVSSFRHVGSISTMIEYCTRLGTPIPYAYVVFTRK